MHETAYLKRKDNSMKKYEKPLLDIIEFENLDVIMESKNISALSDTNGEISEDQIVKDDSNTVSDIPLDTPGETTSTTVPEAAPETTPMEQENSPLEETLAPEASDSVVEPTESVDVPEVTLDISEEADPGVL